MDCSVADEDEADDEDGEDGGAEEAHDEVADAVVVAVGRLAPGGAGVGLALEFVDHPLKVCRIDGICRGGVFF